MRAFPVTDARRVSLAAHECAARSGPGRFPGKIRNAHEASLVQLAPRWSTMAVHPGCCFICNYLPICSTCSGILEAFEWFAALGLGARQLALSWDTVSGDVASPAVQLLKREDDGLAPFAL